MATARLFGQFQHSLDPKNRLIIPGKLREQLGEQVVITRGIGHCLFLFSKEEFDQLADRLAALPMNKKTQRLQHFFCAGVSDIDLDKTGRALLPAHLLSFAGIEKDVVINGCGKRAEIWNADRWNEIDSFEDDEIELLMEEVGI